MAGHARLGFVPVLQMECPDDNDHHEMRIEGPSECDDPGNGCVCCKDSRIPAYVVCACLYLCNAPFHVCGVVQAVLCCKPIPPYKIDLI